MPSDTNCAAALSVLLFYTGDTGDFEVPSGLSGKVTGVCEHGDRAVVEVAMSYEGAANAGADSTRVLTVREQGAWWIATPMAFNVTSASQPSTDGELDEQYRQLWTTEARRRSRSGARRRPRAAARVALGAADHGRDDQRRESPRPRLE